jgi:hypothetical protein
MGSFIIFHFHWEELPARRALLLLLAAVVPAMAACGSNSTSEIVDDVAHCQGLRWPVKTGTDQDAGKVSLTPEATTIDALVSLPSPDSFPEDHRIAPTELTTFQLTNVTMTHFERSLDGDISMTLSDGQNHMEAEIPDPDCVGSSSPFAGQIAAARQVFEQRFPTGASQDTNIPVTMVGVGFFDVPHPIEGAAPNFIELHPVLNLCFEQDCTLP